MADLYGLPAAFVGLAVVYSSLGMYASLILVRRLRTSAISEMS